MLKRIDLKNFKAFKRLDYTCAKLNLLTGLNGAGKSSFIQFLRLMQGVAKTIGKPMTHIPAGIIGAGCSYTDILYSYADSYGCGYGIEFLVEFDSDHPNKSYQIKREVYRKDIDAKNLSIEDEGWHKRLMSWEVANSQNGFNKARGSESSISGCKLQPQGKEIINQERNRLEEEVLAYEQKWVEKNKCATKEFETMWRGARFINAFRKKPHDVHTGGKYDSLFFFPDVNKVDNFNSEGDNAVEYIYRFNRSVVNGMSLVDRVNECLQWISPGAKLQIEEESIGDDVCYVVSVCYDKKCSVHKFKPQHVGFGISYILPVLTALLTAEKGNIIVIENPEAHLHPRGQSEIGKLIAETVARGVQVFVETHSDHVINGIRVAVKNGAIKPPDVNIAFFERKPHEVDADDGTKHIEIYSEVRNIKIDEKGSLSEYPPDFMDEWNIQQMKLFCRK